MLRGWLLCIFVVANKSAKNKDRGATNTTATPNTSTSASTTMSATTTTSPKNWMEDENTLAIGLPLAVVLILVFGVLLSLAWRKLKAKKAESAIEARFPRGNNGGLRHLEEIQLQASVFTIALERSDAVKKQQIAEYRRRKEAGVEEVIDEGDEEEEEDDEAPIRPPSVCYQNKNRIRIPRTLTPESDLEETAQVEEPVEIVRESTKPGKGRSKGRGKGRGKGTKKQATPKRMGGKGRQIGPNQSTCLRESGIPAFGGTNMDG